MWRNGGRGGDSALKATLICIMHEHYIIIIIEYMNLYIIDEYKRMHIIIYQLRLVNDLGMLC